MEGINFLTDDKNNRIAVQIDLKKYSEIWEDFFDILIAEKRKGEETIPFEDAIKDLKDNNLLN